MHSAAVRRAHTLVVQRATAAAASTARAHLLQHAVPACSVAVCGQRPAALPCRSYHRSALLSADAAASSADATAAAADADADEPDLVINLEQPAEVTFSKAERKHLKRAFHLQDVPPTELEAAADPKLEAALAGDGIPMTLTKEATETEQMLREVQRDLDELDMAEDVIEYERQEAAREAAEEAPLKAKMEADSAKAITDFLASMKLGDQAEKIMKLATDADGAQAEYMARLHAPSIEAGLELNRRMNGGIDHLVNLNTRDLKDMGLTVKQRKMFLKLVDRYKVQMRANASLALIRRHGYSLQPAQLQKEVYRIMYGHTYAANEAREENTRLEAEWRAPIVAHRHARLDEHNNLRGLREPELMEMAKIEASQIAAASANIKKMEADEEIRRAAWEEKWGKKSKRRFQRRNEEENELEEEEQDDAATKSKKEKAQQKASKTELNELLSAAGMQKIVDADLDAEIDLDEAAPAAKQ